VATQLVATQLVATQSSDSDGRARPLMEPEPQPGDEPPAAPRAESPLAVFSDDSSTDDGEDLPAEDQSSKELWCCHCSTSPASSQTEHIVKILVRERGWRQWPTEEHVYPGSTSKVVRPKDCTKVAFCNSGFWSLCFEISIDQTELLYDRVNLAKLTSSRDCTTSNICPPSYVIRAGEPPPQIQPSTGPSVWFLKKNLSNFGLGVVAVKTPEEAFELVEPDGVYVLQPHIHRPVLFDGRKFHLRLYLMVAQRRTWTRDQRPGGARFYAHRGATKMPVSSKSWSEASVDKVAQVTTSRGNIRFADWEHCDAAWSAMVETCVPAPCLFVTTVFGR
jgi:hypothetical protein